MPMPYPCVSVAELIESLSRLDPDAPIALIEVQEEWGYDSPLGTTTLTLKTWGGMTLPAARSMKAIEGHQKAIPSKQVRIA